MEIRNYNQWWWLDMNENPLFFLLLRISLEVFLVIIRVIFLCENICQQQENRRHCANNEKSNSCERPSGMNEIYVFTLYLMMMMMRRAWQTNNTFHSKTLTKLKKKVLCCILYTFCWVKQFPAVIICGFKTVFLSPLFNITRVWCDHFN